MKNTIKIDTRKSINFYEAFQSQLLKKLETRIERQ